MEVSRVRFESGHRHALSDLLRQPRLSVAPRLHVICCVRKSSRILGV